MRFHSEKEWLSGSILKDDNGLTKKVKRFWLNYFPATILVTVSKNNKNHNIVLIQFERTNFSRNFSLTLPRDISVCMGANLNKVIAHKNRTIAAYNNVSKT
jgi:hypothetical protein